MYTFIYNGSTLTKVEYRDEGELLAYENVTISGGKVTKIELYEVDGTDEELSETYTYTYSGNNVSKVVNAFDSDGDGSLDFEITYNMTEYDNKINPYNGTPLWILEIDNPLYLSANNPVKGSIQVATETTSYDVTYTYNSADLPTQMVTKLNNSSTTVNFTYDCN